MNLPELPKKYNRKEAKIDDRVAQWFFNNYPHPTLIEVKVKGGRVLDHQQKLIDKVSSEHSFMYKFPDGARRTPLDYIVVPRVAELHAVLAVCDGDVCECLINNKDKLTITV